jgi:hypothetical protein
MVYLKSKITRLLTNIPGWYTKRRIIVIESDDWGSQRMPSLRSLQTLIEKEIPVLDGDSARYNRNDTLASSADFEGLFEVLSSFRDRNNNNPVFTAISLVANPDFDKIKEDHFQQYYFEPFTATLARFNREDALKLWKEGVENKLFIPQFHGREHLNVSVWMRALQSKDELTHKSFEEGFWGFSNKTYSAVNYQAAFDLERKDDLLMHHEILKSGLDLFKTLHGYRADFFVPPNGPFNESLIKTVSTSGIKYVSTSKLHREPLGDGKTRKKFHYLGQKHKDGIRFLTRNAFFEPSQSGKDWVNSCLNDIALAFKYCKPAIISTHRVNYIGTLNPKNRDIGLQQLNHLLSQIVKRWPNVEFLTSNQLGDLQ